MRFSSSFRIWLTRKEEITLEKAIKIAKRELITDMVYDPLGIRGPDSWWWCAAVLEVLQQEDWIREFEILSDPPVEQQIESEPGVIY